LKRTVIFSLLLALGLGLVIAFQWSPSNPPRFEAWLDPTNTWDTVRMHGVKLRQNLFDEARGWGFELSRCLLYDENVKPLGQLTNGLPVAWSGDLLLCAEESTRSPSMQKAMNALSALSRGWIQPLPRWCRYWLLDVARGTTVYIGKISYPGFPPDYTPSPDFQHGYIVLRIYPLQSAYCFDLPARQIWRWDLPKKPLGWWDNTHLLFHPTNDDVCLYDVVTGKTSPLVESRQVDQFLRENQIAKPARQLMVRPRWHVRQTNSLGTDFFLSGGAAVMNNSVLIRIARPDGRLELVSDPQLKSVMDESLRSTMEE
jgi:hypothetical protein